MGGQDCPNLRKGKEELVGCHNGRSESAQSWTELPVDVKGRGLEGADDLTIGAVSKPSIRAMVFVVFAGRAFSDLRARRLAVAAAQRSRAPTIQIHLFARLSCAPRRAPLVESRRIRHNSAQASLTRVCGSGTPPKYLSRHC